MSTNRSIEEQRARIREKMALEPKHKPYSNKEKKFIGASKGKKGRPPKFMVAKAFKNLY